MDPDCDNTGLQVHLLYSVTAVAYYVTDKRVALITKINVILSSILQASETKYVTFSFRTQQYVTAIYAAFSCTF